VFLITSLSFIVAGKPYRWNPSMMSEAWLEMANWVLIGLDPGPVRPLTFKPEYLSAYIVIRILFFSLMRLPKV